MFQPKTIIEPFQIKSVEPLSLLTHSQRLQALKGAEFNLFKLRSNEVTIDLLTDSGTSAMSAEQWASLQRGDESYAGSRSFQEFHETIKNLTGYSHIIPTHQGRASEKIFFSVLADRRERTQRLNFIPNNSHFDTTRANAEAAGFEAVDFPCEEFFDFESDFPFKGNMNLKKLKSFLEQTPREQIPVGFITITNNTCGGQPVSFENLKSTAELYRKYQIPFYLDACRFAENVAFIRKYERPKDSAENIAKEIFRLADGCTFSAKKDAFANIGGFLATNDEDLLEDFTAALILTEGFPTYGGLAGRDLSVIAQGLREVLDESYLTYRLAVTEYMGDFLSRAKIPFLKPPGGHALYLDAKRIAPHLSWSDFPGQSLAIQLYLEAGIRSCEIGSVMFGRKPDGSESAHTSELVRLAIPRRVYTQSHMDYVLEAVDYVFKKRKELKPVKILKEPKRLRHFGASFFVASP
jgi:tryptophanase